MLGTDGSWRRGAAQVVVYGGEGAGAGGQGVSCDGAGVKGRASADVGGLVQGLAGGEGVPYPQFEV